MVELLKVVVIYILFLWLTAVFVEFIVEIIKKIINFFYPIKLKILKKILRGKDWDLFEKKCREKFPINGFLNKIECPELIFIKEKDYSHLNDYINKVYEKIIIFIIALPVTILVVLCFKLDLFSIFYKLSNQEEILGLFKNLFYLKNVNIMGIILSIILISLGTPFWHDIISKFAEKITAGSKIFKEFKAIEKNDK